MCNIQAVRDDHGPINNEQAIEIIDDVRQKLSEGIERQSRVVNDGVMVSFWDNENEI